MAFDDIFDKVFSIVSKYNDESPENLKKILFNEDGTYREDVFGDVMKDIQNGLSDFQNSFVPADLSDLSELSDDEIYDELSFVIFGRDDLNEIQQTALVAYEFEMEFANGGVSQYFVNTRGEHIDELVNCLRIIGAESYAEKCEDFISKYNIKVSDFSEDGNDYDFEKIESMYAYEELEDNIMAFYYDEPLSKFIVDFVRANADDFKVTE